MYSVYKVQFLRSAVVSGLPLYHKEHQLIGTRAKNPRASSHSFILHLLHANKRKEEPALSADDARTYVNLGVLTGD